jgi:hypothetical protein
MAEWNFIGWMDELDEWWGVYYLGVWFFIRTNLHLFDQWKLYKMDGWMDGWMMACEYDLSLFIHGWMDGWWPVNMDLSLFIHGWMGRWTMGSLLRMSTIFHSSCIHLVIHDFPSSSHRREPGGVLPGLSTFSRRCFVVV